MWLALTAPQPFTVTRVTSAGARSSAERAVWALVRRALRWAAASFTTGSAVLRTNRIVSSYALGWPRRTCARLLSINFVPSAGRSPRGAPGSAKLPSVVCQGG